MGIPNHRAGAEWRAGWPLVLGGLVGMGAGPGLFQNISSLFIPGLIAEFGWTRGEIATAAGVGLLGCVAIPFFGRATDRAGPVPVIAFSLLLLGATRAMQDSEDVSWASAAMATPSVVEDLEGRGFPPDSLADADANALVLAAALWATVRASRRAPERTTVE